MGKFNFVYLSPKIFLNNQMFTNVSFSPMFQNQLALVVVDEAHMIYSWGLVQSGQKKLKILVRHQDVGVFQPSYGNLGGQLLTKSQAPMLLMLATSPPQAVQAIKDNLLLLETHINILQGKLTRPEIHIIQIPMSCLLKSANDLLKVYPIKDQTPESNIVPSLVYSGPQNHTLQTLRAMDVAQGTPDQHLNASNTFARRYHACTGQRDKEDTIKAFTDNGLPIIACTLALGMGQNWSRVQQVIHFGRDFAKINPSKPIQSDDDRMDALAITPLCLRVAFAIHNRWGYIPLDANDPLYCDEVS
ncbi:hypothetical protein PCANC_07017 [Puccinia coronata f. sp. avenae]|uniref:DNA 3'-5' helicase n=1 Tax=Puccinia coronata f. sp. avenae TaxID=200324 RepID=A0A2N5VZL3_9BASI|nr:hypothetical protein PCANC_07017 [Puccinia coronata f. sp. avenae]